MKVVLDTMLWISYWTAPPWTPAPPDRPGAEGKGSVGVWRTAASLEAGFESRDRTRWTTHGRTRAPLPNGRGSTRGARRRHASLQNST